MSAPARRALIPLMVERGISQRRAYALLRNAGVPLGKADFLGPIGGAG